MEKLYALLFVGLFTAGSLYAQQKPENVVPVSHIVEAQFHGETAPLVSYQPAPDAPNEIVRSEKKGYHPKNDWPLNEFTNPAALPIGVDPAWQSEYATPNTNNRNASITQDFAGIGFTGVNPPDPVMDVGPNHIIQMVNAASGAQFQIWDKMGNSLLGPTNMDNFFNSAIGGGGASGLGDPIVLYDQLADRWFMAEFASGSNDIYILVSTSADPTGTWYAYTFTAPNFPDYLKFSVWPNAYTMTSNESGPSGVYAFDRTAMLAGLPATMQRFTVPDYPTIAFQATTPVGVEGPTPPPVGNNAYFMRMADDAWSASIPADRLEIWELDVDFLIPANSTFSGPTNLLTDPFDTELCGYVAFACMDQPSGTITLDPLREVLMFKVQYRNFGTHESIVCNHVTDVDGTDRGGVRWYELRRTGMGPWSIYQQGTYSPDSDDRWMGAININSAGQIGLLFNRSSSVTNPGIYFTGRNPSDPLGTMSVPETVIEAGAASNASNRYGDYNSLSVDPSNEMTFWGTAEYNPSSQWGTRVSAFMIDPPAATEEIIITEIMQNPNTISDANGEWFEVYNPGDTPVDLNGWTISDNDSDAHVIGSSVTVPSGGYALLGRNSDSGANGGLTYDYVYGNDIELANSADELILTDALGNEIDRVEYDGGPNFPDPNGASMNLDPFSYSTTANNDGSNWCEATTSYEMNNSGTPGSDNTFCSMPLCNISGISLSNLSACDPVDDSFTADVTVSFTDPLPIGSLNLSGDATASVATSDLDGPTSHTFTGVSMSADGGAISLTAEFSAYPDCTFTEPTAGTAPAPCSVPNDDCQDAIEIFCDDVITGNTSNATSAGAPPNCVTSLGTASGVWYSFTGTGELVELTTCNAGTDYDTKLGVFTGSCGALNCVVGDDDDTCPFSNLYSRVFFSTTVGEVYYVYVTGFGSSQGTFELSVSCFPPPANDDVCNAINLEVNVPETVNNLGATVQMGEPSPGPGSDPSAGSCNSDDGWCSFETSVNNSVWYVLNVQEAGCYEIFTTPSDLQLAIYQPSTCMDFSSFIELGANDDSASDIEGGTGGLAPGLNLYLETGGYFIQVDGFAGAQTMDDVILVRPGENCQEVICEESEVQLTIVLDNFPGETTWELNDDDGNFIQAGGPYPAPATVTEALCSDAGCYEFTIFDSFGDGICCGFGAGSYSLDYNGSNIYSGNGQFGASETIPFCINSCTLDGWSETDIGTASTPGSYECTEGEVIISSSGQNGFGNDDNMSFLHQQLCGDGEVIAKVEDIVGNGYAGLVMREGTSDDDKSVGMFSDLTQVILWQARYATGGPKVTQSFNRPFPIWLKVERQGDWFFGYYSATGPANFQYVHAVNVSMASCIEVGLGVFSSIPGEEVTATYSNVEVNGGILPFGDPENTLQLTVGSTDAAQPRLFPNPTSGNITLDFRQTVDKPTTLVLRNKLGQIIKQRPLELPALQTDWDMSELLDGIYLIEIHSEGEAPKTLRFIKG